VIKVIFDRQIVNGGVIFDRQTVPAPRFPIAGLVHSLPIKAVRVLPLAGKQRKYP